jgi:hypothetical protein
MPNPIALTIKCTVHRSFVNKSMPRDQSARLSRCMHSRAPATNGHADERLAESTAAYPENEAAFWRNITLAYCPRTAKCLPCSSSGRLSGIPRGGSLLLRTQLVERVERRADLFAFLGIRIHILKAVHQRDIFGTQFGRQFVRALI